MAGNGADIPAHKVRQYSAPKYTTKVDVDF